MTNKKWFNIRAMGKNEIIGTLPFVLSMKQ